MAKTKCLIVDDEPLAIEIIENHLSKFEEIEIVDRCNNAIKAFEVLRKEKIDLIFLDIQMPKITGVDFLKTLTNPPKVIFTTAYRDYAIDAYELDVVDYLLKPISFERFMKAINKFYEISGGEFQIFNQSEGKNVSSAYIYIKADKKFHKVYLNEILYVEALKDYLKIHCSDKRLVTLGQIGEFEKKLPQESFVRIHRSYIAALNKITAFNATQVDIGDKELPIGRSYKYHVLKTLNVDGSNM